MENRNEKAISTLNDLIEFCKDGQHGYSTAAEDVKDPELKSLFNTYSQQRAQFVGELKEEVRHLGGDPEKSGSATGSLHRTWIDLRSAVSSGDPENILSECERGENAAEERYDKALKAELPSSAASIVKKQHDRVRDARDQIKALKNRM